MITGIERSNLSTIKNPAFAAYAERYVAIYEDFLNQVRQTGIEVDPHDYRPETQDKTNQLKQKSAILRNDGKSIYINRISPACEACQTGAGCGTYFVSLKCHRDCFYCFNPNQEQYEYYSQNLRDASAELEQVAASGQRFRQLALTGGEPLLFKEEALRFFETARRKFPSTYTRLYTCGDYADEKILKDLQAADLKEIRFSIRMHDLEKGHRYIFDRIALAKQYIPYVMVEMPVLPGTLEIMQDVLLELERLEIFSINLLEFCFPYFNTDFFNRKGYRVKIPPFRVLYNYWYAGGLPIAGSELECLDLLEFALDRGLKIGVHFCSLENKHTGQIYQQNSPERLPKTSYFSQKDYFIKTAKVFGEDIHRVLPVLKRSGDDGNYVWNQELNFLEFNVHKMHRLAKMDVEVGITSSVHEEREGEKVVRELNVGWTTPQLFDLENDV